MVKTAAGILAGGKSSRMGKNKASLTWNGDTFLHTLIDACRDFPEIYVSVDDREKYRDLSCTLVEDEEKEYGPLEGIYQVLKQMDAPYAVMLATDMPMISREFLKALVSNITGEEDCLVLRREGRPQPLCSVTADSLVEFVSGDGRDTLVSGEEILAGDVYLAQDGETYRLVIPKDTHRRRWCKHITEIESEQGG